MFDSNSADSAISILAKFVNLQKMMEVMKETQARLWSY